MRGSCNPALAVCTVIDRRASFTEDQREESLDLRAWHRPQLNRISSAPGVNVWVVPIHALMNLDVKE